MDADNIQCLVSRVKDGNRWAIIDRSGSLSCTVYIDDNNDN
jgi:hypothetical protein